MLISELVDYANSRYHDDEEFHDIVDQSVYISVPETTSPGINLALREASRAAASVALILYEQR